jgi:hypothetical protein
VATTPYQVGFSQAILEPGVRYYTEIGRKAGDKTFFEQLLTVEGSTKAKETIRNFASFGAMTSVGHGQELPPDQMLDGYQTVLTHVKYAKVVGVDKETIDDDQYDIVRRMGTLLGRSIRVTKEIVGHLPFNRAFDLNLSDGVPLISASHPVLRTNGLASNVLAPAGDPSFQTWSNLNTLLLTQKDSAGFPLFFLDAEKVWLINPAWYDIAIQSVNSSTAITFAGSVNPNASIINPWAGKTSVIASPYFDYDAEGDASILFARGAHEGYMFVRKDAGSPESWTEKNPEVMYTKATMRLSSGFTDWRGVVGTAGA